MTDEKNNPHLQSNLSPFPGLSQLRQQAEQKAKAMSLPDLDSMSHEEIRHMMYEMQVKQIEADLLVEQLRSQREERDDQAELLSIVTENMLDMVALTDMEGNFTYAGKAHEILGYKPGFLIGKNVLDFVHPEDFPYIMNEFGELVESGLPRKVEYRYRCSDDTYLWLETMGNVIKDENGIPQKIVFSSRDITERKSREDERRELIDRLLALINSAGDLREIISALLASLQSWSGAEAVGIRLVDGEDFPYYETRGFPPEFIEAEKYLCVYGPDGQILRNGRGNPVLECMCGNVISGSCDPSKPFFTNHGSFWTHSTSALLAGTTEADRQGRTRNRCHGEGYESVALIPLRTGDQVFGLLQFNDPRSDHFTPEQVAYFESVADSIAAGLSLRQAEESRLESETKYRMLFDSIDAGFCIIEMLFDSEGKPVDYVFLEANPAFVKHTGLINVIGRRVRDLNPKHEEHWFELYGDIARTGKSRRFVESAVLIDGWHEGYAFSIGEPGSNRVAVLFRDITERKRGEQALRDSEDRFRAIVEGAPDAVFVQTEKKFAYLNSRAVHLFGAEKETDLLGRPVTDRFHPDYHEQILERICRLNEKRQPVIDHMEQKFLRLDGSEVWVETTGQPIVFEGKNGALVFVRDITERKKAEEEKEKLQTRLIQAQKMESVGRLAGGVAHDFNNKLSIINGYAELAMETIDPSDPLHESIQEIHTAGKKSADIVRQLLAFARKQTISPVQLDLNDTISSMLKMLQRLIGENIDLTWHPGNNLWSVKIDPSQVDQVMANLAVNSRDAISDVGKLTIETKNTIVDEDYCKSDPEAIPGQYVMLSVSDSGSGMDRETLENLFEPFFTTKEIGKGTGLGLPTVYGIVKQNNGFINVYSEPGEGTIFKIYLPCHEEQESSALDHLKEFAEQRPTGSETILFVEDARSVLHMGRVLLEKLGYTVLTAEAPSDALQLAEEYTGRIQLLITDVIMPEMNGRDLAMRINLLRPEIKTIYISSYTKNVIAHLGVLDNGVHYIQKPFSMQELAVKVREVIEQE